MNYRHLFHAGNFTEIVKHSVLTVLLEYLQKKPAAICYIDTHAGEGLYDLSSEEAARTGEHLRGVQRFISSKLIFPECLHPYLQVLQNYQKNGQQIYYPGSPFLASHLLRPQDRIILNEFHPEVYEKLKQNFKTLNPVNAPAIHHRDAYEFLPAILPPQIKRGITLIDPPFEQKEENLQIKLALEKALKRWPLGTYMIWYPITGLRRWNLKEVIVHNHVKNFLTVEILISKTGIISSGLIGCEILVVNPPWQISEELTPLIKLLWNIFSNNQEGGWKVTVGD